MFLNGCCLASYMIIDAKPVSVPNQYSSGDWRSILWICIMHPLIIIKNVGDGIGVTVLKDNAWFMVPSSRGGVVYRKISCTCGYLFFVCLAISHEAN